MIKKIKIFTGLIVLIAIFAGCIGTANQNLAPEAVPLAKYDEALSTLLAIKTSFNSAVTAEPDPLLRKKMLDVAYPIIKKADAAIALWKSVIDSGQDPAAEISAYNAIWLELTNSLRQLGIVEVR